MVQAPGVAVPPSEAEATRRRLAAEGRLRADLAVLKDDGRVVFPVADGDTVFDFRRRDTRARTYQETLPDRLQDVAPRAFEPLGDIVLVKVPRPLWGDRGVIGAALLDFVTGARAVFHDHGVEGEFRVRRLQRIAGTGDTATTVTENGCRLHVDPAAAYFSPRLADERARIAALVRPGECVVDLFGGVAPQGVQAARKGAAVVSIDLNPEAVRLARLNAAENGVVIDARVGDARDAARDMPAADRIVMNLPHGAKDFLDVAAKLAATGATIHHHEILRDDAIQARCQGLEAEMADLGRRIKVVNTRHVRNYSAEESHIVFDMEVLA